MTTPSNDHTTPPTAAPCADCTTIGGYTESWCVRPRRTRGLCAACYSRHKGHGTLAAFSGIPEGYEGIPEGHAPTLRAYPGEPALDAPLHPPLPAPDRWGHVIWFRRPLHDPFGQRLYDAEACGAAGEAA